MKIAYLYLSFACNNLCLFCASDKTNKEIDKKQFTLPEAIRFMEKAKADGYIGITISGGEPTIHPNILDIIKHAANLFKQVNLASNGILLADYRFALKIVKAGVTGIGIPLYSSSPDTVDRLVGRNGAFGKITKGIRNLEMIKKKHPLYLRLKILVMKQNYRENPKTVEWIKKEFPSIDGITVAGLRVSEKVLENLEELFVPFNISRPYTSTTIQNIIPLSFSLDFLPLCALEPPLVKKLIREKLIPGGQKTFFMERPDGVRFFNGSEPFHYEECCGKCPAFQICSKVHKRNSQFINYQNQLESIPL